MKSFNNMSLDFTSFSQIPNIANNLPLSSSREHLKNKENILMRSLSFPISNNNEAFFTKFCKLIACSQNQIEINESCLFQNYDIPLPKFYDKYFFFNNFISDEEIKNICFLPSFEEVKKYQTYFEILDFNKKEFITSEEMKSIYQKSLLPKKLLAKIWHLSELEKPENINNISFKYFALSVHLLNFFKNTSNVTSESSINSEEIQKIKEKIDEFSKNDTILQIENNEIALKNQVLQIRDFHSKILNEKENDYIFLSQILTNYQKMNKKFNEETIFFIKEINKLDEKKLKLQEEIKQIQWEASNGIKNHLQTKQTLVKKCEENINDIFSLLQNTNNLNNI